MDSKQIVIFFPEGKFLVNNNLFISRPESVFGSYLLAHPEINELKIDQCNCGPNMNLEIFKRIYDFLSGENQISDLSDIDINILDELGLLLPTEIQFRNCMCTYTNQTYKFLK